MSHVPAARPVPPFALRLVAVRRLALTVGALGLVAALGAAPALAFWTSSGAASAGATARALAVPAAPTAVGSATSTWLVVSGTLPTGVSQVPGTTYTLNRDATTLGCSLPTSGTYSCTDTGLTGATTYSYTVVAAVGAWRATSAAKTGATTCPVTPKYTLSPSTTTPTAGTALTVTITATGCSGATDTAYSGSQAVTFSGPSASASGKAPAYPATVTFTNGVGTATVTLYAAETTALTATTGALTGTTASLQVKVTTAAPWTVLLTNPANTAGAVTVSCTDSADLNQATHSCSQTSAVDTGNGRTWSGRFTLVDRWGNPQVNTGAAVVVVVTASNGQTRNVSIATGSATSGTFSIPLANGSSTITLTATTTVPTVSTTVTGAG